MRSGYVYLLAATDGTLYKIGASRHPVSRRRAVADQRPCTLLHRIRTADQFATETALHHYFATRRHDGEWFCLTMADVALVRSLRCDADVRCLVAPPSTVPTVQPMVVAPPSTVQPDPLPAQPRPVVRQPTNVVVDDTGTPYPIYERTW